MKFTRRQWHQMAVAAAACAALPSPLWSQSKVRLGVSTFSFRDRSRNGALTALRELGADGCELFNTHVYLRGDDQKPDGWLRITPAQQAELREFRLTAPRSHFEHIRAQFDRAGIELYLYYSAIGESTSEEEVEREFQFAKWLGVKTISFMTEPEALPRFVAAAERHDLLLALHNSTSLFKRIRNVPSAPAEIESQLQVSPRIFLNFDAGHFYGAGHDPVPFLKKNFARISNIQLKDRRRPEGPNVPCGQGGAPNAELVRTVRENGWPISISIEYEHAADDLYTEVKRCLTDARSGLGR